VLGCILGHGAGRAAGLRVAIDSGENEKILRAILCDYVYAVMTSLFGKVEFLC
jgi:hypothetical protein